MNMSVSSQRLELADLHLALMALGLFLLVVPLGGILPEILPARLGESDWRFGALGYYLNGLTLPTIGLVVCLVASVLRSSSRASRITAAAAFVLALLTVVALPFFFREGAALAAAATDQRVAPIFSEAVTKASMVGVFALPCLVVTGVAGLRQGRRIEAATAARRSSLVV